MAFFNFVLLLFAQKIEIENRHKEHDYGLGNGSNMSTILTSEMDVLMKTLWIRTCVLLSRHPVCSLLLSIRAQKRQKTFLCTYTHTLTLSACRRQLNRLNNNKMYKVYTRSTESQNEHTYQNEETD